MIAVIGLGFGDEGKGRVVDHLCRDNETRMVVRFSGGPQAGHTVVKNGIRHVFSNFGSGTMAGVHTYWHNTCLVNPITLMNELDVLSMKVDAPYIVINPECPVITPYDTATTRESSNYNRNGTCGMGIGATWQREEDHYHLEAGDLCFNSAMNMKLEAIKSYYYPLDLSIWEFTHAVERMLTDKRIRIGLSLHTLGEGGIIAEGSQGLFKQGRQIETRIMGGQKPR